MYRVAIVSYPTRTSLTSSTGSPRVWMTMSCLPGSASTQRAQRTNLRTSLFRRSVESRCTWMSRCWRHG